MDEVELISYEDLKAALLVYMKKEDIALIDKYYEEAIDIHKDMKRQTGEDYIYHPLAVAYTLANLKMDPITIGSALIHEALSLERRSFEEIKEKFGEETAVILQCSAKISSLKRTFNKENNVKRYRRIIVGLAENPKTLFIKFADRLHNMKTIYVKDRKHQLEIIDETVNILIPIAHRLGIKKIMSELEDLCLRYSDPEEYTAILNKINASRDELEKNLSTMRQEISELLTENNIKFKLLSRVKSVRGIYNKLKSGKTWENIYDLLGLRILVEKREECYLAIGLIHSKYRVISKRYKDYIANPKTNMYQSLHTTIFGTSNMVYEVQVRTYEMDEIAESGVASHWSYKEKENGKVKSNMEMRLEQFRALIESKNIDNNLDFFKNINKELKAKEIYAFTPKGDAIELPYGSTPIDFAYKIHSEVGNTTINALVNNKIVKLDYILEDGDTVELLTKKGSSPNKNWLKFVKTEQAKGRIKSYFYKKERDKLILLGKKMIEAQIKKKSLSLDILSDEKMIKKLLEYLKLSDIEEVYFNIGTLKYLPSTIIDKLVPKKEADLKITNNVNQKKTSNNDIIVDGNPDILTSIASCCNPVHGEDIVGYVSRGYGIKVHSANCSNVNIDKERLIKVRWNNKEGSKYKTYLNVYVLSKNENITTVINLATKLDINVEGFNLIDKNNNEYYYEITCRVNNLETLKRFMEDLAKIKFVTKVERIIK